VSVLIGRSLAQPWATGYNQQMISSLVTNAKFDNEDILIGLLIIAITIFYVGKHQRVRYRVIFGVIGAVEMVLIGLLWWTLWRIGPY
jgi:hypothetical protein